MNYFGFKSLTKSIWPIRRYPPYPDFTVCYIQLYVMNWIYIITRFNCIYDKTGATYLFEEGISFHGKDVRIFTGFEQKTYLVGSKMSGPIRWKVRVYQTCQGPAKISALPSPVNVSPHRTCQCSPEMYGPKNMSNPTESDKFYQLYSAFLPISFIQRSSVFFHHCNGPCHKFRKFPWRKGFRIGNFRNLILSRSSRTKKWLVVDSISGARV